MIQATFLMGDWHEQTIYSKNFNNFEEFLNYWKPKFFGPSTQGDGKIRLNKFSGSENDIFQLLNHWNKGSSTHSCEINFIKQIVILTPLAELYLSCVKKHDKSKI